MELKNFGSSGLLFIIRRMIILTLEFPSLGLIIGFVVLAGRRRRG